MYKKHRYNTRGDKKAFSKGFGEPGIIKNINAFNNPLPSVDYVYLDVKYTFEIVKPEFAALDDIYKPCVFYKTVSFVNKKTNFNIMDNYYYNLNNPSRNIYVPDKFVRIESYRDYLSANENMGGFLYTRLLFEPTISRRFGFHCLFDQESRIPFNNDYIQAPWYNDIYNGLLESEDTSRCLFTAQFNVNENGVHKNAKLNIKKDIIIDYDDQIVKSINDNNEHDLNIGLKVFDEIEYKLLKQSVSIRDRENNFVNHISNDIAWTDIMNENKIRIREVWGKRYKVEFLEPGRMPISKSVPLLSKIKLKY